MIKKKKNTVLALLRNASITIVSPIKRLLMMRLEEE